jgi:hypothetical protein
LNSVRTLESRRTFAISQRFPYVEVKRDRLPRFGDRVVTPRERVISCLQWPAQHFGDGDGRGREAQVPAPRPSKSGSKREKERILLPGHRPGSGALRGNVEGLLTGGKESRKKLAV